MSLISSPTWTRRWNLTAVYNAIPYPTVVLARAAADLATDHGPSGQRLLATDARELAVNHWYPALRTGPPGRGAPSHRGGGRHRPGCAAVWPERYSPDFAHSLINLSGALSELGRLAEALPVIEEAVAIDRELAAASPDRYRPDLAHSLTSLAATFSALGRPADAWPLAEAVAISGAGRCQP